MLVTILFATLPLVLHALGRAVADAGERERGDDRSIGAAHSFADQNSALSEESVGESWLWKPAEHVIQRELGDPERPMAVRFSQWLLGLCCSDPR